MLNLARRLHPCLQQAACQVRFFRNDPGSSSSSPPTRRRSKLTTVTMKKPNDKSDWWVVDGEMHEIGENVPPRERFVIPRDNVPNWRRKKLREQFMRRTRLVLKESEHEPWCRRYMELYNELRENWERLYWDEGYSKKIAQDHANCDSAEDDDEDFSPYRRRQPPVDQTTVGPTDQMKDQSMVRRRQDDTWVRVNQIRDKFEYDRERRMRQNAFAPMNGRSGFGIDDSGSRNQPFDTRRYFPPTPRDGIDESGSRNQPFDTRRYFPPTPRDVIDDSGSRNQPLDTRRYSPPTPRDGIDDSGSRNQPFDTRRYFPPTPRD